MRGLKIFEFENRDVRVRIDETGNPWWVAKDVCDVLGYSNARDAVNNHVRSKHKDDVAIPDAMGRNQFTSVISEPGLYSLVLRSKLPSAVRFQDWITEEVLPSIRKHSAYLTPQKIDPTFRPGFAKLKAGSYRSRPHFSIRGLFMKTLTLCEVLAPNEIDVLLKKDDLTMGFIGVTK